MKVWMTLFTVVAVLLLVSPVIAAKRFLYVDSCHEGFTWSDGITNAIQKTLRGHDVNLKIHRMDTKRNPDEKYKIRAVRIAKSMIDNYRPDLVIASDDNASKYIIMPYYKNGSLPFLFCGVNYSADAYGSPYSNVTEMYVKTFPVDDIPIVRKTQADIMINLKIANKLGLKIPDSFRKIAYRIIE